VTDEPQTPFRDALSGRLGENDEDDSGQGSATAHSGPCPPDDADEALQILRWASRRVQGEGVAWVQVVPLPVSGKCEGGCQDSAPALDRRSWRHCAIAFHHSRRHRLGARCHRRSMAEPLDQLLGVV